jgi:hypothetical protein
MTIKECPNHEGAFDCSPFCRICEGAQEYETEDSNKKGKMITSADITTVEKNHYGAWVISAFIGGYLVTRQFYGYTKRQAVSRFLEQTNN